MITNNDQLNDSLRESPSQEGSASSPNDPKLSDGSERRDSCAGNSQSEATNVSKAAPESETLKQESAASVTRADVRWSAWLGVADIAILTLLVVNFTQTVLMQKPGISQFLLEASLWSAVGWSVAVVYFAGRTLSSVFRVVGAAVRKSPRRLVVAPPHKKPSAAKSCMRPQPRQGEV